MFCPQCGKQLPDGSSFCSSCGYQTSKPVAAKEYQYKATFNPPKGKGKVVAVVAVAVILVAALAVVGVFLLKGNRDKQFIDLVKNGYLGGYSDITVLEMLEEDLNVPSDEVKITWKSYEDKALGRMVNADCTWQGKPLISYCFHLLDDQVFEVSSVGSPDLTSSDAGEISTLLNQMYVTHYNKQGMDIEVLTEKLSNIHVSAVLYGAPADYSGNRGDLYLKYRSDTQPYSVAEFLGLVDPMEVREETTAPNNSNGDNLLDLNDLVGTYSNDERLSGYVEISHMDSGQFNVRVQDYRVTLLDAIVESPVSSPMVLVDEGGAQLTFTFYPEEHGVYLEDTSGAYNGWYYRETQGQGSDTQFWGTYNLISTTPNTTAQLEIIYASDDGQIYLSGSANYGDDAGEVFGLLEVIDNQHFRFENERTGAALDMSYEPSTGILTVNEKGNVSGTDITFAGSYAQTSGAIEP